MEGSESMHKHNRMNVSGDLDALLRDVQAATEEVKQRQDADKQKDIQAAEKQKTKKSSLMIIAVATVVLLVAAYFVVFAGPNVKNSQTVYGTSSNAMAPTPNITAVTSTNNNARPNTTLPTLPNQLQPQRAPQNSAPPTGNEQPTGM